MEQLTLARARTIAVAINEYGKKNKAVDFDSLVFYVEKSTRADRQDIVEVITFLQELSAHDTDVPVKSNANAMSLADRVHEHTGKPLDLASELQYNYGVAKALLQSILEKGHLTPDSEEIRKTLREISRFSDSMLKLQERLYNVQQLQRFQEAVIAALEDADEVVRDKVVNLLLEAEL